MIRGKSFGVAFLIHLAAIFFLVVTPWRRPSADAYDVFTVRIVELPRVKPEPPATVKVEADPLPEPARPAPAVSAPATPARRVQPERRRPAFSTEKFREELAARLETTRDARDEAAVSVSSAVDIEIEKIDERLIDVRIPQIDITVPEWYVSLVHAKIKENWRVPHLLGQRIAVVSFRIFNSGEIGNVAIEQSSGNRVFDRSVTDAVRSTRELPVFPPEMRQTHLDIVIEFKTEG